MFPQPFVQNEWPSPWSRYRCLCCPCCLWEGLHKAHRLFKSNVTAQWDKRDCWIKDNIYIYWKQLDFQSNMAEDIWSTSYTGHFCWHYDEIQRHGSIIDTVQESVVCRKLRGRCVCVCVCVRVTNKDTITRVRREMSIYKNVLQRLWQSKRTLCHCLHEIGQRRQHVVL